MPPDRGEVRRWLIKAKRDWSAARKLMNSESPETDVAAFHCQQAVEKILKAVLVHGSVEFEKVHDIGALCDQCSALNVEFDQLRSDLAPLTLYAVAFRYPGPADPTLTDVNVALLAVEQVWNLAVSHLPKEAVP